MITLYKLLTDDAILSGNKDNLMYIPLNGDHLYLEESKTELGKYSLRVSISDNRRIYSSDIYSRLADVAGLKFIREPDANGVVAQHIIIDKYSGTEYMRFLTVSEEGTGKEYISSVTFNDKSKILTHLAGVVKVL